ncbi:hypothetical protein N9335_01575 [Crocinitomicaceae bacterium]|nr:hypothetical protein [Crocinitomicaceae bacterium]
MSKLILFSLLFIPNLFMAQTIKVTVNEAQIFAKYGTHSNQAVLKAPDEDRGLKQIDCDYTFDLEEKTCIFFSRSLGGVGSTLPIHNITRKGSVYILEIADHGYHDASLSYPVIIYVDIDKETMLYTFYDQYFDRSFVQKEGKIKMTVEGMQ